MYTSFLVPFDGSRSACTAVETAIEMSSGDNIDIVVLHVLKMTDGNRTSFDVAAKLASLTAEEKTAEKVQRAEQSEAGQALVQEYFDSLPESVDLSIVVKRGNPADLICQYAADNNIDCIVMGRRGLGGIRAALGSVSTAVLRGTDLPVLVVK